MWLLERNEPGKSVRTTMAHLGRKMARSADLASLASFAGNCSVRAWLDVGLRKLGAKAEQQLPHANALEPVGVPTRAPTAS